MSTRSIPWPRILAEGFAIVVSILLAFGIQAWWEGRQARETAARRAAELRSEFTRLQTSLRTDRQEVDQAEAATRLLLDAMGRVQPDVSSDSLAKLFYTSWSVSASRPEGGALLAILGSGALGELADDSLSQLIAEWPAVTEAIQRQNDLLTANREGEVMARLRELGVPQRRIAATGTSGLDPGRFDFDLRVLTSDVALESTLTSRVIRLRNLRRELERAAELAGSIQGRLAQP